jgi:hypothetical protein
VQSFQLIIIGSYTCQVFWKGDPGVENFIMRFATESKMETWYHAINEQRKEYAPAFETSPITPNPYAEQDDDTDDEDTMYKAAVPVSLVGIARPPPLRFSGVPPPRSALKHRPPEGRM